MRASFAEYIKRCREIGIIVCGIGIGCNLRWVFGEDFIRVDTETMGPVILQKLKEILNRQTR